MRLNGCPDMKEVICTQESEKWKVKDAIERVQRASLFETMPSVSKAHLKKHFRLFFGHYSLFFVPLWQNSF